MNTLKTIIISALLAVAGNALAADGLHVAAFTIAPGETMTVPVELQNPDDSYIMLEFWMQLPEGVSIDADADGFLLVTKNSERLTQNHPLEIEAKDNNSYKVLIYSTRNAAIKGNSGAIFTMQLTAAADAAVGSYEGRFYSQVFSNADKQEYDPAESTFSVTIGKKALRGDVNEDGKVDIADVTEVVNIILEQ
jgi:hypothetical protein